MLSIPVPYGKKRPHRGDVCAGVCVLATSTASTIVLALATVALLHVYCTTGYRTVEYKANQKEQFFFNRLGSVGKNYVLS